MSELSDQNLKYLIEHISNANKELKKDLKEDLKLIRDDISGDRYECVARFDKLDDEVKELQSFKWKVIGAGALCVILIEAASKLLWS